MRQAFAQAMVAAGLVLCFRALFGPVPEPDSE